jgi:hypothetical protein
MKAKSKFLFIVLILSMLVVAFPGAAFAQTDQYGYDAQARTFKGTLDNWEAFLDGLPPTPFSWKQTDTVFIERNWDKLFDPMVQGNPPSAPGAWEKANLWEYLSGDQLGWTWHQELGVVYSPNTPIPGATALTPEEILFTGFYLVKDDEWLEGPNGEKTIVQDFLIDKGVIKKALKFHHK